MNRIVINILFLFFILMGIKSSAQHQELYELKTFIDNTDTLNYRILYPKDFSEDKQYPLVLFLHGAGERGSNNASQLTHGSKLFASENNREVFPAIVVFPQCPQDDYWANASIDRSTKPLTIKFYNGGQPTKALGLVMQLMDTMVAESFVDKQKVYVGGLSMGGMGTFEILYRKSDMFAAAFAICGGGNTEVAEAYAKTIDLWIFHGAKDDVVVPQFSIDMVSAILNYGGKPNFTLYADDNHNSWDSAFAEPKLLPWLFSKSKKNNELN
ncbi:MAG: prolyl oligopeptidase family serine peptidase [Flavobacteriales bacterium]